MDGQTDGQRDSQRHRQMDGWRENQIDRGGGERQTDGRTDRWTER